MDLLVPFVQVLIDAYKPGIKCSECNTTFYPDDWSNDNILQTTDGIKHKKCPIIFRPSHDFDKNGIIYWLGTNKGKSENWINPVFIGNASVISSSIATDSNAPSSILGRKSVRCVTKPKEYSWFLIDLRDITISPTHYTLRHYSSHDTEALRTWHLDGYHKGNWYSLSKHEKDTNLYGKGSSHTWSIGPFTKTYSKFRIKQFGVNSNKHHYLALSGFEIYGKVTIENNYNLKNDDEEKKNNHHEEEKLIKDLFTENSKLRQELNENKQISAIKENELHRLKNKLITKNGIISKLDNEEKKGNKEEQKVIESLLSENIKLQQLLNENKQISAIREQELDTLNHKLMEKNDAIKALQAEYYKLITNKNKTNIDRNTEFKLLQSKLEQTEILMKAYQNDNVRIKDEYQALKRQLILLNDDEKKNDHVDEDNKCKIKFANWLSETVKLPQYLSLFKEKEYNDIRMIEFFDNDTIENEIDIKKALHRKLLLKQSNEFKLCHIRFCQQIFGDYQQLKEYKRMFEMNGILTMDDLKNDIKNKQQLENMLNINDTEILNLIWSIAHRQQPEMQQVLQPNDEGQDTLYF